MTVIIPVKWNIETTYNVYCFELYNVGMKINHEDYKRLKSYLSWENPPADWYFDDLNCSSLNIVDQTTNNGKMQYMTVSRFNPLNGVCVKTFNQQNIQSPNFIIQYINNCDLSVLHPYIIHFISFEDGIDSKFKTIIKKIRLDILTSLFPSLSWITECKGIICYNDYSWFFIGYNNYYIGMIRIRDSKVVAMCYNKFRSKGICICGYHVYKN